MGFDARPGQQFSSRPERGDAGFSDGSVHGVAVGVQPFPQAGKFGHILGGSAGAGAAQFQGPGQLVQDHFLGGLMAVQLQASIAQPHVVQPAFHHLQRRHLLGHEQHRPAVADGFGNHVGDGLGLAGARRALDDQVQPLVHVQQGQGLRAVGIDHVIGVARSKDGIQVVIAADQRRRVVETVLQQRPDDGVLGGGGVAGPGLHIQVPVHQELAEGEEPQGNLLAVHGPAVQPVDGVGGRVEIGPDVQAVHLGQLRQGDAEFQTEFFPERNVGFRIVAGVTQPEPSPDVDPFQTDRQQHQGGKTGFLIDAAVPPPQHAQGQKEGVHTLLLDEGIGQAVGGQQAPVEFGGRMGGVQLQVTPAFPSGVPGTVFGNFFRAGFRE